MAFQLPIKYFNSFWLKKVVGDTELNPDLAITTSGGTYENESTVTTTVKAGWDSGAYALPTWPGVPWGDELTEVNPENSNLLKGYPCFPWGGRDWSTYSSGDAALPACNGGSLLDRTPNIEAGYERCWFVEEARIRGGFNNTSVDFGVKAYLVEDENLQQHRFNTMIYSGIYNSRTGLNNTNVFSTADGSITTSVDPGDGSIQKLYAYNTNLTIFQENKVSKALIDKDAIYSAEGQGTPVSSLKVVIGQIIPYKGEYGISTNPESWAQYGFRQYFADRFRNCILRLSNDGLTEISSYGMTDYFRDRLDTITSNQKQNVLSYAFVDEGFTPDEFLLSFEIVNDANCDCDNIPLGSLLSINGVVIPDIFVVSVTSNNPNCLLIASRRWSAELYGQTDIPEQIDFISYNKDKIIGGFDTHNKNYVVSIQDFETNSNSGCGVEFNYETVNFDEAVNGWVSFYSYKPVFISSLKNDFYSSNAYGLYKHYSDTLDNRGVFYGVRSNSSIEFIFNANPSQIKNFQTVSYEGTSGWQVDFFRSDVTEQLAGSTPSVWYGVNDTTNSIYSLLQGEYNDPITGTVKHAGFYRKENLYCANLVNSSVPFNGEVVFGTDMSGIKGYFATIRLSTDVETTDSSGNILAPTNLGGLKELYAVSTKYVKSS